MQPMELLQPPPPLPQMLGLQVHATTKRQEKHASRHTLMRLRLRVRNTAPPSSVSSSSYPRMSFYSETCNSESPSEEVCAQNSCKGGKKAVGSPGCQRRKQFRESPKWPLVTGCGPEENRCSLGKPIFTNEFARGIAQW